MNIPSHKNLGDFGSVDASTLNVRGAVGGGAKASSVRLLGVGERAYWRKKVLQCADRRGPEKNRYKLSAERAEEEVEKTKEKVNGKWERKKSREGNNTYLNEKNNIAE